jgi:hypothetical protein
MRMRLPHLEENYFYSCFVSVLKLHAACACACQPRMLHAHALASQVASTPHALHPLSRQAEEGTGVAKKKKVESSSRKQPPPRGSESMRCGASASATH